MSLCIGVNTEQMLVFNYLLLVICCSFGLLLFQHCFGWQKQKKRKKIRKRTTNANLSIFCCWDIWRKINEEKNHGQNKICSLIKMFFFSLSHFCIIFLRVFIFFESLLFSLNCCWMMFVWVCRTAIIHTFSSSISVHITLWIKLSDNNMYNLNRRLFLIVLIWNLI